MWMLAPALALTGCSDLGVKVRLRAQADVSSIALDFGTLAVNDAGTRMVTVRNTGNAELTGNASVACSGFQITLGGGPFTLAPGQALDVTVRFQPAAATGYSCVLDLGPGNPQVALSGAGALQPPGAAWTVTPTALDFGGITVGQSVFRTFKIRSTGTAPVTVNVVSPCPEYLPVTGGGPATIPPADSVVVNLLFNPLSGGPFPCTIAVGPGIAGVSVQGVATTVSFANDIQPIFSNTCIGCHPISGGLDLSPGASYSNLVNVTTFGYAPARRIVPSDTVNSVLYVKITKSVSPYGQRMPQNGPQLPRSLINKIGAWIIEGAKNN